MTAFNEDPMQCGYGKMWRDGRKVEIREELAKAARAKRDTGKAITAEEQASIAAHDVYVAECVDWAIADLEQNPAPAPSKNVYAPTMQAPEQDQGRRAYRLTRSEAYAQAVYEALKARNIAPPVHPPIRRQQDASMLLFRCGFRADDVAHVLGVSKRHALVLKSKERKAQASKEAAARQRKKAK